MRVFTDWAADQFSAHRGDDAEAAAVVAAFGNLQIGVVARSQLDALGRYQVDQRVVVLAWWHHLVNGIEDLLILLRAGHRKHAGVHVADCAFFHAHAASHDHFAVFCQGFTDHFQRLGLGAVDKATGVNHHHVGVLVGGHHFITFHAQLGQDAFGVHQCLGATE
jgi:hypothetical protein